MSPRPFARALRTQLALCLALTSLAGCQETVSLGSECPPMANGCVIKHEGGEVTLIRPNTPGYGDAGVPGAVAVLPGDASVAGDAAIIPLPVLSAARLQIDNPSFEREGGIGGDVVLTNLIGGLLPFDPVTFVVAALPRWYACFPLSVTSATWAFDDGGVTTSKFGDYLSFTINGTSVRQELTTPLEAGKTYSFEIDTISESQGADNLFVEVRGATKQCGDGTVLGRSAVVPDSSEWVTTCVTFSADQAYSHLLLAPSFEGDPPPIGAALRMDSLRQVDRCP